MHTELLLASLACDMATKQLLVCFTLHYKACTAAHATPHRLRPWRLPLAVLCYASGKAQQVRLLGTACQIHATEK